ncbi:MAG: glycosyltransferase family 2 protein [Rhodocyclaceae bacterium]|nr:glycosyltransferase family 2 protein [Rhodocyclaceae bacterium]
MNEGDGAALRDRPELSVVIVSYNVEGLLADCLASLRAEARRVPMEVFVVDSASRDGTVAMVRRDFPEVTVFASAENIGFSAGNNRALGLCRGRFVVLLNPDTVVHEGAFATLVDYLGRHPEAGAAGPTLRLGDGTIQSECARNLPRLSNVFQWLALLDKLEWKVRFGGRRTLTDRHPPPGTLLDRLNLLAWARDRNCAVESIAGACMLMRREVVDAVGFLDEALPLYLDDIDYCRRIHDAGWEIHYVADAAITHFWEQSSSQLRRAGDFYAMQCHALWLYFRKHEGSAAAGAFAAMVALAGLGRLVVTLPLAALFRTTPLRRQLHMVLGLCRWALRWPKTPPRFGFACETGRDHR